MTEGFAQRRIRESQALTSSPEIRHLGESEVDALHEEILGVLQVGRRLLTVDFSTDVVKAPAPILDRWLEGVDQCLAYWSFDREAIELPARLLVPNINDLWRPGELVWLCSPTGQVFKPDRTQLLDGHPDTAERKALLRRHELKWVTQSEHEGAVAAASKGSLTHGRLQSASAPAEWWILISDDEIAELWRWDARN
jgi:hypothetical protein